MGDYGLKITKATKAVSSSTPEDYVFSSKFGSVKIFKEPANKAYLTQVVNAGSNATITIAHGLPFVPMVMFFIELKPGSGHWYTGSMCAASPSDKTANVTFGSSASTETYVDSTNIIIKLYNATASQLTVKYYYYIFADNG